MTLWLRDETKKFEQRSALSPESAKVLIQNGINVVVEKSQNRIFSDNLYQQIGCTLAESQSWKTQAPTEAYILGLKELPNETMALKHKHIYFAHAYKNQNGAAQLLKRFKNGKGQLLDLEYLVDDNLKRIAAFGYWAGFVGAAVGLEILLKLYLSEDLKTYQLKSYKNKNNLLEHLKILLQKVKNKTTNKKIKALIIGSSGRCGTGAKDLLQSLDINPTGWGPKDTKDKGLFKEILDQDLFLNCVFVTKKIPAFLSTDFLNQQKTQCNLKVISDVSCDPTGPYNPLPLYDKESNFDKPIHFLNYKNTKLHLSAVDHLPSVLPTESSKDFSLQLLSHLLSFLSQKEEKVFAKAIKLFKQKTEFI